MGDTFTIGQAQDTFTVGIGADGFTVAPEVNLFELGADVTAIEVNYGSVTIGGATDPDAIADAVEDYLAANPLGILPVQVLVDKPVTVGGSFTPPIPAGLKVILNAQANPAEDGLYLSNGSGGVTGSPTPIKTLENYASGLIVAAQMALTAVSTSTAGALYDPNTLQPDNNFVDLRMVTTPDGVNFYLSHQSLPSQALLDLSSKAFSPAMNDFGGINVDTELTLNHAIVSCNPSTDITITLAPHATKPRHCYVTVEPYATGTVTLVQHPSESVPFECVLNPGDRALILPDQAEWEVWQFPPEGATFPSNPIVSYVTSSGTLTNTSRLARCDTTGGSFNLTLQDDNPHNPIVQNEAVTGTVTVKTSGGATISTVPAGARVLFVDEDGSWSATPLPPDTASTGDMLTWADDQASWEAIGDLGIQPHSVRLSELATLNTNLTVPYQVAGAWTAGSMSTIKAAMGVLTDGLFGTGADGDVTIAANTSITSDMTNGVKNYRNLTINSGVTLTLPGGIIFVSDTLTLTGNISANGNNGASNAAGATVGGPFVAGTALNGGANGANSGAGTQGAPTANPTGGQVVIGGGRGGSGGTANSGGTAGGTAGALASLTSISDAGWRSHLPSILTAMVQSRATPLQVTGGGTGGGAGAGSGGIGGGGGSGGGCVIIVARHVSGSGTISANGGNGGNAFSGNSGGGGGGGGGFVVLFTGDSSSSITLTAAAGTGGTALGTGANGVNGSAGNTLTIVGAA